MHNFYDFCDRINGRPYTDGVPEPVAYNFQPMDLKVGGAELTPLDAEDMARYAYEDVVDHMQKMQKAGFNPTKLGNLMTDLEFRKFMGQTW